MFELVRLARRDPGELVVEGVDVGNSRRPADVVRLELHQDLIFRNAAADQSGRTIDHRVELRLERLHVGLREHRSVAGNGRVEVERENAREHLFPLEGAAAAGVVNQRSRGARRQGVAERDNL